MDAFNEAVPQSEAEAFEFGFPLAARLMTVVMQSAEISSGDEA